MGDQTKLFFRFRSDVSPAARTKLVQALKEQGASSVHRLFPGAKEPDLAATFVAESPSATTSQALSRSLRSNSSVELVQKGAKRRPI